MKQLSIDEIEIEEIGMAMKDQVRMINEYFLDTHTGKVEVIPVEILNSEEDVDSLPEWEKDLLTLAEAIQEDEDRYLRIPEGSSGDAYDDMVGFSQTVKENHLRELLMAALNRKKPFRQFKDISTSKGVPSYPICFHSKNCGWP